MWEVVSVMDTAGEDCQRLGPEVRHFSYSVHVCCEIISREVDFPQHGRTPGKERAPKEPFLSVHRGPACQGRRFVLLLYS
jgi:hypothetical protein